MKAPARVTRPPANRHRRWHVTAALSFFILAAANTTALASPVQLKCAGPEMGTGHFISLWIDYDASTVVVGTVDSMTPAFSAPAKITQGEISWQSSTPDDLWHYALNRYTGGFSTVSNETDMSVTCQPVAAIEQKF